MIGDFDAEESEPIAGQFLHYYNVVKLLIIHIIKAGIAKAICSDVIIANSPNSFENTSTFCTGLSGLHELVLTAFLGFRNAATKVLYYRDYNKINADNFKTELKQNLAENLEQAFSVLLD